MTRHDLEYYTRREREERASAERTRDATARLVHLEMAERYSARMREILPTATLASA